MSEKALVHYLSSEWEEAEAIFQTILEQYPNDIPAKMFIDRCKKLKENPFNDKWDWVYRLTQK